VKRKVSGGMGQSVESSRSANKKELIKRKLSLRGEGQSRPYASEITSIRKVATGNLSSLRSLDLLNVEEKENPEIFTRTEVPEKSVQGGALSGIIVLEAGLILERRQQGKHHHLSNNSRRGHDSKEARHEFTFPKKESRIDAEEERETLA